MSRGLDKRRAMSTFSVCKPLLPRAPGKRAGWVPDTETLFMAAPDTLVRDARPADAPGIAAIGTVAVPETYRDLIGDPQVMSAIVEQSYAVDALRDCIARCTCSTDAHFLVAEQAGRIVGFLHYDCQGPDPELHRIYADPERKRRGIGSALLEELHRRLEPGASYVLMVVAANRPALAFYAHHGLVERGRLDGVAYMHERMGVVFAPGTPEVPALILGFTKTN
jgi:[ribosomal protein S18]-alanine N-acetyltransferase